MEVVADAGVASNDRYHGIGGGRTQIAGGPGSVQAALECGTGYVGGARRDDAEAVGRGVQ